jgi:DNA polymerase elongation subunit (family B)
MPFKNIFYDKFRNNIHLWTDEGYNVFPYNHYGYIKTKKDTPYKTIFGDNVMKVPMEVLSSYRGEIFESDVKPEIRTLVDMFGHTEEVSKTNKIMVIDIETSIDRKRGYSKPPHCRNSITAITCIFLDSSEKKTFVLDEFYRYKNTYGYDFVETCISEVELIKKFYRYLRDTEPSIITSWNGDFFDMPYIYWRTANLLGIEFANKFSPIGNCYYNERKKKLKIAGISQLDYLSLYKKYTQHQRPSYKLDYIAWVELGKKKVEYDGNLQDLYERDLDEYVHYNIVDVDLIVELEEKLKFLSKAIKLAHLGHVPYEDVLSAVLHSEGLFLTETRAENLVCPNKPDVDYDLDASDDIEGNKKDKIVGAFVKESKRGRFEYTYDEDLTSLYPLIAVTNNISPESKFAIIRNYIDVWQERDKTHFKINYELFDPTRKSPNFDKVLNMTIDILDGSGRSISISTIGDMYKFMAQNNLTVSGNGVFYKKDNIGIIPKIILKYFALRKKYKDMRDECIESGDVANEEYYDSLQWSYKIIINSLYGVLCNKFFRFYDKDNGQSITLTGRFTNMTGMDTVFRYHKYLKERIKEEIPKDLQELFDDPILTGDTDSIILTALPALYAKYGENMSNISEDELLNSTLELSKHIAKIINERMGLFAKNWLNADKNYLSFKQEWVARVGFYTGVKKRYANKIVIQEGKRKEKLDIKGLDIVRSSFPLDCQIFMKEVLTMVLEFKDKRDIDSHILKFYSGIKNMNYTGHLKNEKEFDITSIAPITSLNKYDDYTRDDIIIKKGASPAIKGAVNFNKFLDIFEMNGSYKRLNNGDKVSWVYLHPNELSFKTVTMPLDSRIPKQMVDYIYENADINKSISSLLHKKIALYYEAMSWKLPQQEQNNIMSIFE